MPTHEKINELKNSKVRTGLTGRAGGRAEAAKGVLDRVTLGDDVSNPSTRT